MPTFWPDKNLEKGDCKFKTRKNAICVKWMDNRAVTLIGSNVLRRQKGASSKSAVPYPIILKKYLIFAAYHVDWRSKFCFYLHIFFDLIDVAMVNSFTIYKLQNALSFLDFKLLVPKSLIGSFTTRTRDFPSSHPTKQRLAQVVTDESQSHCPEYQ